MLVFFVVVGQSVRFKGQMTIIIVHVSIFAVSYSQSQMGGETKSPTYAVFFLAAEARLKHISAHVFTYNTCVVTDQSLRLGMESVGSKCS